MKNPFFLIVLVLIAAVGGSLYFWKQRADREARIEQIPPQKPEVTQTTPPSLPPEPEVTHPLPETPTTTSTPTPAKPLPALSESDASLRESLAASLGKQALNDIVITKDIARRIAATIDNLPRRKLAERLLPIRPPAGHFLTTGQGEIVTLSPSNYARYNGYVSVARTVDAKQIVGVYLYYYPLFQQAYQELGYPKKQFNDRVIQAIDDLLATPSVAQPVELVRPKVLFEFEDPDLEDLSAGQKLMIRIGPENAAVVKGKLREIRRELVQGVAQR